MYNYYIKDFDEDFQSFLMDKIQMTFFHDQKNDSGDIFYKLKHNDDVDLLYIESYIKRGNIAHSLKFAGAYIQSKGILLNADYNCCNLLKGDNRGNIRAGNALGDIKAEIKKLILDRINTRLSKLTNDEAIKMGGGIDDYYREHCAKSQAEKWFLSNSVSDIVSINEFSYELDINFLVAYLLNPKIKIEKTADEIWVKEKSNYATIYLKHQLCLEHYKAIIEATNEGDLLYIRRSIINSILPEIKMVQVNIFKEGKELSIKMLADILKRTDEHRYPTYQMDKQSREQFEAMFGRHSHLLPEEIISIEFRNKILYKKEAVSV